MTTISQTPNYSLTLIPTTPGGAVAQRVVHLRYPEAPKEQLASLDVHGNHKLMPEAAASFKAMQQAAKRDGVFLEPVSAFRNLEHQKDVFFTEAKHQGVSLAERSKVAAPPGYSEHGTGYVVDIMDSTSPDTARLDICFEQTPAYSWLKQQANRFGFELSFPQGNWQGINYEPWHWRYVGSPQSQQVFQRARFRQLA